MCLFGSAFIKISQICSPLSDLLTQAVSQCGFNEKTLSLLKYGCGIRHRQFSVRIRDIGVCDEQIHRAVKLVMRHNRQCG
jgi:hypothetical protein